METDKKPNIYTSLVAGAAAGIVVDLTLFPLDTIKTRLQSKSGFVKTGGFHGVYKGIVPVLLGSAPTSAIFFMTYNSLLNVLIPISGLWMPVNHVMAASCAEFVAAAVRVPIEIVKQRKQVALQPSSGIQMIRQIIRQDGVRGIYRGFSSTLGREIPFGCIQYPMWELFKELSDAQEAWQIALCGAAAGTIAAAATTPMDVIKTRVMLSEDLLDTKPKSAFKLNFNVAKVIYREKGVSGLFAGIVPRVLFITFGGFIYFGIYGKTVLLCDDYFVSPFDGKRNE